MNITEFKQHWDAEKPIYEAWGSYVVENIKNELTSQGENIDVFLKIPAKFRLKDDASLLDKAFYRPSKSYSDPYNQIEDKVGARFVVLLLDHITKICNIIESNSNWTFDACKHFDEDKEKEPLLFSYQSVHYILRPKKNIDVDGVSIPVTTPCEVQIRTLLQHAHAELTHDAIYKAKRTIKPKVHRTVAKSMALIETTDDFFSEVTQELNTGPLEEFQIIEQLDSIYFSLTGLKPINQKSTIAIWDAFEQFIDENLIENIRSTLSQYEMLSNIVLNRISNDSFYQQSIILFIYWLLKRKKNRLLSDWPLPKDVLEPLAVDLGISINNE